MRLHGWHGTRVGPSAAAVQTRAADFSGGSMSIAVVILSKRVLRAAAALAGLVVVPAVCAQDAPSTAPGTGPDPVLIVTRTVQPRIAYRGLPRDQNPVHTQATVFPAQVFHRTLDGVLGQLVGDDALNQTASAGVAGFTTGPAMTDATGQLGTAVVMGTSQTALQGGIAGTVGGIGGAGGPIGRATGGLAGTITGALLPVLGAVGGSEGTGGP